MLSSKDFILYLLLAIIPAVFINQFLLTRIQPKKSFRQFIIYFFLLLAITLGYTILVGWILLRFVWPLKQ
ncbi:MAG TPA: hypothetical protein VFN95_18750 [Flavitalea sp.]|nr:hypothetical protein [Flavitalea sp.]